MIRDDFPFFKESKTIYLDTAATSQKPQRMIDALVSFYTAQNANIHRGNYKLSREASQRYDEVRKKAADFINADPEEIVFTKGATEGLNFIARSVLKDLKEEENVVVSDLEHSSAYFPFKRECERKNASFRSASVDREGRLILEDMRKKIDDQTKLVVISGMSNVNGFEPDLYQIIETAHSHGASVLVDAAQLIVHKRVDVKKLNCDYLAFSAHKLYGPMGVGCLYIKKEKQKEIEPLLLGGGTITDDPSHDYPLKEDEERYEAGTPDVAGVIAFGETLDYLNERGWDDLLKQEEETAEYLYRELSSLPSVHIKGYVKGSSVLCFKMEKLNSYDIGVLLSLHDIAVRTGGHCAYPMMRSLNEDNLVRVSLGIYSTKDDVDALVKVLKSISR